MKIKANNEEFNDYTLDTANPNPGFTINLTKDTNATFEVVYRTTSDDTENKEQKNVATLKWQGVDESDDTTVGKEITVLKNQVILLLMPMVLSRLIGK